MTTWDTIKNNPANIFLTLTIVGLFVCMIIMYTKKGDVDMKLMAWSVGIIFIINQITWSAKFGDKDPLSNRMQAGMIPLKSE